MLKQTGIILIIIMLLTSAGCWDVQDVADSAFITAIGLDASDKPDMIKVTFNMPKPTRIRMRSDVNYAVSQTVEDESITGAVEKLETRLSRNVRFGHLRVIVVGEKLSKRNFRGYTNFFSKNPEIALRTRLIFVQGAEAREVFDASPVFNRSMVTELVGLAMAGKKNALERTSSLQDLRKDMFRSSGTVLAPRIVINRGNNKSFIEHEGAAVLKGGKVIGWLDQNEMKSANLFFKDSKPKIIGKLGESRFTFSIDRKSTKIIPKADGNRLSFLVELNANGNITEEQYGLDLSKPENIKKVQRLLSRIVTDQAISAIYHSQKLLKADYLGFGKALEIRNPQQYKALDWNKVYPDVPVTVKVQANVHRFGKSR